MHPKATKGKVLCPQPSPHQATRDLCGLSAPKHSGSEVCGSLSTGQVLTGLCHSQSQLNNKYPPPPK